MRQQQVVPLVVRKMATNQTRLDPYFAGIFTVTCVLPIYTVEY
jgi:hypothetical protein